jgi:hypothetical protein
MNQLMQSGRVEFLRIQQIELHTVDLYVATAQGG